MKKLIELYGNTGPHQTFIYIAVVGDEPMIDSRRFGETVAVNRGAFGKVFTDFSEAKAWLKDRNDEGNEC